MSLGQKVALSLLATATGWLAGVLAAFILMLTQQAAKPDYLMVPVFGIYMLFYVGPTWLLLVLPTAILVPGSAAFWRPAVAGIFGAVSGFGIMAVAALWAHAHRHASGWFPLFGGIATLVGATSYAMLGFSIRSAKKG